MSIHVCLFQSSPILIHYTLRREEASLFILIPSWILSPRVAFPPWSQYMWWANSLFKWNERNDQSKEIWCLSRFQKEDLSRFGRISKLSWGFKNPSHHQQWRGWEGVTMDTMASFSKVSFLQPSHAPFLKSADGGGSRRDFGGAAKA